MKKTIAFATCFACLLIFALEVVWAGNKASVYVYVKNRKGESIYPDKVQMDGKNMSRAGRGVYHGITFERYHTFCAKKGSEIKCKRTKIRPPSTKRVTIRFSRH